MSQFFYSLDKIHSFEVRNPKNFVYFEHQKGSYLLVILIRDRSLFIIFDILCQSVNANFLATKNVFGDFVPISIEIP